MLIPRDDRSRKTLSTRKPTITILAAAIAGILCAGPAFSKPPEWAQGRILVAPKAGLSDSDFDDVIEKNKGRRLGKLKKLGVHIVEVQPQAEKGIVRALSNNPHIEFAELDMLVEPSQDANDPKFSSAWHLPKIRATEAWDVSLGSDVTVAILDTGIDRYHPDLLENIVSGWNVASNNSDISDVQGHGTKVAGTVAARSNNGLGVASIAWNASIMPIRVSNSSTGSAYFSTIANGVRWAADHGAHVANISYDNISASSTVTSAAQYMRGMGGVVVAGAGNSGSNAGHAVNPSIISVSATNSSDIKTSWSSYGNYVDFAAPGAGIWTTTNGGGYGSVSGTSFSSPVTAAVVALMMSVNPSLSPDEIEAILQYTAVDLGTAEWDEYYGFGRIDAAEAVNMAADADPTDSSPPSVAIDSPSSGNSVSGLVPVVVGAIDNLGVTRVELFANGSRVGTDYTGPDYEFSWDATGESINQSILYAKAYDAAGNTGTSAEVEVIIQNADNSDTEYPKVDIHNPKDGEQVSGNVAMYAIASDNQQLSIVSISVDGKLKCSGSATTLSCNWNTRKAASGSSHTISARATDVAGNISETSIDVTVGGSSSGGGTKGNGKGKNK